MTEHIIDFDGSILIMPSPSEDPRTLRWRGSLEVYTHSSIGGDDAHCDSCSRNQAPLYVCKSHTDIMSSGLVYCWVCMDETLQVYKQDPYLISGCTRESGAPEPVFVGSLPGGAFPMMKQKEGVDA